MGEIQWLKHCSVVTSNCQQLRLPLSDLIGMDVKLLRQFRQASARPGGGQCVLQRQLADLRVQRPQMARRHTPSRYSSQNFWWTGR
jgi:hypothetical protein